MRYALRRLSLVLVAVAGPTAVACGGGSNDSELLGGPSVDATAAASCMTLASCCPALPMGVAASCNQLAAQAGAAECTTVITALGAGGLCRALVSVGADSGAAADATLRADGGVKAGARLDAGIALACVLLEACCASPALPADELASCQSIQGAGDETDCTGLLGELTAAQSCSGVNVGSGGACPDLAACCATQAFPAEFLGTCEETVAMGDETTCATDLGTFVPAGYCGGVIPSSDGGHGHAPDPSCTTLAMCCGEINFPMEDLSTCQQIASGNSGGTCLSAYESYSALAYCE